MACTCEDACRHNLSWNVHCQIECCKKELCSLPFNQLKTASFSCKIREIWTSLINVLVLLGICTTLPTNTCRLIRKLSEVFFFLFFFLSGAVWSTYKRSVPYMQQSELSQFREPVRTSHRGGEAKSYSQQGHCGLNFAPFNTVQRAVQAMNMFLVLHHFCWWTWKFLTLIFFVKRQHSWFQSFHGFHWHWLNSISYSVIQL